MCSVDPLQKEGKLPSAQGQGCKGLVPPERERERAVYKPSGQNEKGSVFLGQREVMEAYCPRRRQVPQVQLQNQV